MRCWAAVGLAIACLAFPAAAGACASDQSAASARPAQVYEVTLLRSHAQEPDDLVQFIERNWFAMDEAAQQAGLIASYEVRTRPRPAAGWNVAVIVGYPDPRGYEGVRGAFEAIRAQHQTVPVAGARSVRELGVILGSSQSATPTVPD